MNNKAVSLVAIIIVAAVLVLLFHVTREDNRVTNVSFDEVALTDISVVGDTVTLSGSLLNSAKSYRKYAYTVESDTLYLTISAGLVNHKYPHGDFTIEIRDPELQNISTICLKRDNKIKKVYPK